MKKQSMYLQEKPGTAAGPPGPKTLISAIKELAPELLNHPSMLEKIRKYVSPPIVGTAAGRPSRLPSEGLRRELEPHLPPERKKNLGILLSILDGIEIAYDYFEVDSEEGLENYLEDHQRAFEEKLFGHPGRIKGLEQVNMCLPKIYPKVIKTKGRK